ncbi:MAG: UbiD family decarboxylase [Desulfuromonas sp.]|nr:UbiD family decarboxylase [Desulfuromonas sp.]
MFNHDDKCSLLRENLSRLQSYKDLATVTVPVSGDLELAALIRRSYHRNPALPALLFTAVAQSKWTILANLFGTKQRCAQLITAGQTSSLSSCSKQLPQHVGSVASFGAWLQSLTALQPRFDKSVPMSSISGLFQLPRLQIWPEDAGMYLSMAVVIWRSITTDQVSCGLYRVQIHSDKQASFHWRQGSDGARDYVQYRQRGIDMPVTIVLGGDPALTFAAAAPLPSGTDEYRFAAFLQQQPLDVVLSEVNGLPVPTQCEFILEGLVSPHGSLTDGPFGNHQGFYSQPTDCPIFNLVRISARDQAIFPVSIIGPPPSESSAIGGSFSDFYLPLLQREIAQLLDIYMPEETVFHGCAMIRLRVDSMLEQVKEQLRSSLLLHHSKLLIYVDEDIDVRQPQQVFWRAINQFSPDIVQCSAGQMEIDTTQWRQQQRRLLSSDPKIEQLLTQRWGEYGLE